MSNTNTCDSMQLFVVDSIMGSGKTTAAINYINEADDTDKFFFITPYLAQVDRIIAECSGKQFKQPRDDEHSKRCDLKQLLQRGENIVTTHAMFRMLTSEILHIISDRGYILIMDETIFGAEEYRKVSIPDIQVMLQAGILRADDDVGFLKCNLQDYSGQMFYEIKQMCDHNCLGYYRADEDRLSVIKLFPIKNFLAFRKVYVLTYMFEGQIMASYLALYGIKYQKLYVTGTFLGNYQFSDTPEEFPAAPDVANLIRINETRNGKWECESLSHTWYDNAANKDKVINMRKNIYNWFHNDLHVKPTDAFWTCYKSSAGVFGKMQRYSKRYLPLNARATNEYMECTAVAYPVNLFCQPYLNHYFAAQGIQTHEDQYATAEMLQFIWRSAVRLGRPIDLYVPSARMRRLLQDWITSVSAA